MALTSLIFDIRKRWRRVFSEADSTTPDGLCRYDSSYGSADGISLPEILRIPYNMSNTCRFPRPAWMSPARAWCLVLLVFSTCLSSTGQNQNQGNATTSALNAVIRDYALRMLTPLHTGILYEVPLLANFSGVKASVMRLRSGGLWRKGANISEFHVPPRTLPVPFTRRLALVYQDLGNWSASYFRVPGHLAITPVLGLLAYGPPPDSGFSFANPMQLDLHATGGAFSVRFPRVSLPQETTARARCARFELNGSASLDELGASNVCLTTRLGHFAIVVPLPLPSPATGPSPAAESREKNKAWTVWVAAWGFGVVGLVLVGLASAWIFVMVKNRRMEAMEREAEGGEALRTVWVRESKMPSATMTRTRPVLEDENAP